MGFFDTLKNGLSGSLSNSVSNIAQAKIKDRLPSNMGGVVGAGMRLINGASPMDVAGDLLTSGLLRSKSSFAADIIDQALYMNTPNPLFGGITPKEAKEIYSQSLETKYARKNLFLLEVSPYSGADDVISKAFNLFATEVSYSPWTIGGEKRKIGGIAVDTVHSTEPMEMRITTMDDEVGTLKVWFKRMAEKTAHKDGTVGLPKDYLIKIKMTHSFIKPSFKSDDFPYRDEVLVRVANIDLESSRRDSAMQEITMTFTQHDNFFKA